MNVLITGANGFVGKNLTQRLSTIKDADMIIVVADGRVAESGSHDELLAKKGFYYNPYKTQYAGFAT